MKTSSRTGTLLIRLGLGYAGLITVAGCGATDGSESGWTEDEGTFGASRQPLSTWQNLSLNTGWYAMNGSTPSVAIVDNVLIFRGAIAGTPSAGIAPFSLPPGYVPNPGSGGDSFRVRVVMSGNAGGTLSFVLNAAQNGLDTYLIQDGLTGPGAGRSLTSLDGIAVDMTSVDATALDASGNGWSGIYSFRNQGEEPPASAKLVGGFVRFQGLLTRGVPSSNLLLFRLPSNLRPSTPVHLPVALHDCSTTSWDGIYGRLNIATNGNVTAQAENGNWEDANCGTSLENASFAVSGTSSALSLRGTWAPYSIRPVRVRNEDGIIRFEGAIRGGSTTDFATLPAEMRPSRRVWVVADSANAAHARIRIESDGIMRIDQPMVEVASVFLSLDGVFFAK